jgi:hypothetical protein
MVKQYQKFVNAVITTTTAHGLSTGSVVKISNVASSLNAQLFYIKPLTTKKFSLFYDSSLTRQVGADNVYITSTSTITPMNIGSLTYVNPGAGSGGGSGGGGSSSIATTTSFVFTTSISANLQNFNLSSSALAAGWNGVTSLTATITINNGVYVWSDTTSVAAFTVTSLPAGSTVNIVNYGFIIGKGGKGGNTTYNNVTTAPTAGGPAMSLGYNINLTNNSYIAGGGGGGASAVGTGGGGAGGGEGGDFTGFGNQYLTAAGGAGGAPGLAGSNGAQVTGSSGGSAYGAGGGGGGGRILPGVGGVQGDQSGSQYQGLGGGAGGGGGVYDAFGYNCDSTAGGSANNAATQANGNTLGGAGWGGGGGGGGWGAAGGASTRDYGVTVAGAAGGKAIALNGYTVTYVTTGTIYGVVS